ncbi:MAG: DinB family protein [Tunicatimonas sp.]
MADNQQEEVWLRGPVAGVPALLLPVAHALRQAQEEVHTYTHGFPTELLNERPAGLASVGFHLQHLRGVLDRLFTYARGEALTETQLEELRTEGQTPQTVEDLVKDFDHQVERSIRQLQHTPKASLTDAREVGRAQLPSTVLGLLFHAAEHTMRHVGQLLVTIRILRSERH